MLIYFQVQDRALRSFLNDFMMRFPFPSSAGETPPGLTDTLIFYDPLVTPTRPGYILPSTIAPLLESGQTHDAQRALSDFMMESMRNLMVEHESELEMLAIEEEDRRRRMAEIDQRRKRLTELSGQFSSAVTVLKNWNTAPPADGTDAAPPSVGDAAPGEALAGPFFSQLSANLKSLIEKTGGNLDAAGFDDTFRLTFDLGLASDFAGRQPLSRFEEFLKPDGRVIPISEYLVRKFSDIFQLEKIRETRESLASIEASSSELKTRLAKLQQKRSEMLAQFGARLAEEFDRQTKAQYQYFQLDHRRRAQALTSEEKKQFGILEDQILAIGQNIDSELYLRFSSSPAAAATIGRINQAVAQSLQELIRVLEPEPALSEQLSQLTGALEHASARERWLKLDEQVRRVAQFAKLLAGRSRNRPFAAVSPPPWPATKIQVKTALDEIQRLDTTLFPEKFLRRRGPPGVLLVPCFGSGLYDWKDGILVVSLYPDNLKSAVLTALAEFRMDADESRELFNSYGADIKRNRGVGFVKLKEQFISDYGAWILKEAAGFRVMEKDVRSWFERKIPLQVAEEKER